MKYALPALSILLLLGCEDSGPHKGYQAGYNLTCGYTWTPENRFVVDKEFAYNFVAGARACAREHPERARMLLGLTVGTQDIPETTAQDTTEAVGDDQPQSASVPSQQTNTVQAQEEPRPVKEAHRPPNPAVAKKAETPVKAKAQASTKPKVNSKPPPTAKAPEKPKAPAKAAAPTKAKATAKAEAPPKPKATAKVEAPPKPTTAPKAEVSSESKATAGGQAAAEVVDRSAQNAPVSRAETATPAPARQPREQTRSRHPLRDYQSLMNY